MEKILKTLELEDVPGIICKSNEELDKQVQLNLTKWHDTTNPLAPLSDKQFDIVYRMREVLQDKYFTPKDIELHHKIKKKTVDFNAFVQRMIEVEKQIEEENMYEHNEHLNYLEKQAEYCEVLYHDAEKIVQNLSELQETYKQVVLKTNSLHNLSEHLMTQQQLLKAKKEEISERLKPFTSYQSLRDNVTRLSKNINSDEYLNILDQINLYIDYLAKHPEYKESFSYKLRYENLLVEALQNIIKVINDVILLATKQVLHLESTTGQKSIKEPIVETAFSFYYGKFQNAASKISKAINYIEVRILSSDMSRVLNEIHKIFFSQRGPVMQSAVSKALTDLRDKYKTDHSILFRSAGLFIIKVCQDETHCYQYFFSYPSQQLNDYLSSLCQNLYDTLRPSLISVNHIEVLTELCTILKEMINEHYPNNDALDQFVDTINQLLQDVEERLVFRTNIFFQYDLNAYEPSPGDLAYPQKLEQMENIAEEIMERRASSRASSVSLESHEVANINAGSVGQLRSFTGNSPADLHGMWYPTVKRTLVCLSRLYLCLDKEIFQGVAQEGLIICLKTIEKAAEKISAKKSFLDGRLFQIKHLLILREQIAPFQVDFTIKEMSLDFSNVKNAAVGLVQHRDKIFSLSSNNALLEFLLEGTPKVREYLIDSRKEIDKQLKASCEAFIANTTNGLIGNIHQWLQKAEHMHKLSETYKENAISLRDQEFTKPQILAGMVSAAHRNLKTKIPDIQRSMRLYLANRETEFILFRPIKNNIINTFIHLEQLLVEAKYTNDDRLLIACPSSEQLNVLISSVSLTADHEQRVLNSSNSSHSERVKMEKI